MKHMNLRNSIRRAVMLLGLILILLACIVATRTAAVSTVEAPQPIEFATVALDVDAAASRLSQALRFETVSRQDGADEEEFATFRVWLVATYPRFHAIARRTIIGGGTLVYEWAGADSSLQPIVLMAHQDVVPAQPAHWRYPPFSGAIAEGAIWGRGALDDKSALIAIMEAAESLLAAGHRPARSLFFVFGHDEEVGGDAGARAAAQHLAGRGIKAAFVLDEGGISLSNGPITNAPMTLIGVAEKGYLTLQLQVTGAGGHSNAPGSATAVDTLAKAIVALRSQTFSRSYDGVTRDMLDAIAPHAPLMARMAIANSWMFEPLLMSQLSATPQGAAVLQTTIAPTMLQGSPKENVLPTAATATVNFRIMPGESIDGVIARVRDSLGDLPVKVTAVGTREEPSPIANTDSDGYRLIAGLAASTFDAPVAPLLMIGMTDSRHMRLLTDDIYRFTPMQLSLADGALTHGIDERISIENLKRMLSFYQQLLIGSSAADWDARVP